MITNPSIFSALSAEDQAAATSLNNKHIEEHARMRIEAAVQAQAAVRRFGPCEVRLLVVPALFEDVPLTVTQDRFTAMLQGVASYYEEVSAGNVKILFEIVDPVLLPLKCADYSNNDGGRGKEEPNARTMARDALLSLDRRGTDFMRFDANHDNIIDAFVVVHAGRPAESFTSEIADLIWSHRGFRADARTRSGYLVNEFLTVSEESPLGVWCHELGHLLFNWPDVVEQRENNVQVVHTWCLMSSGGWNGYNAGLPAGGSPAHPCAPLKIRQGWLNRSVIQANGECALVSIETSNTAIFLPPPTEATRSLVLENRTRIAFDRALPGDGLLIWDVVGVDDVAGPAIKLVPAYGTFDAYLRGTADDPFPGNKHVTSLDRYGITINRISNAGPTMQFDVLGFPSGTRIRAVRQ